MGLSHSVPVISWYKTVETVNPCRRVQSYSITSRLMQFSSHTNVLQSSKAQKNKSDIYTPKNQLDAKLNRTPASRFNMCTRALLSDCVHHSQHRQPLFLSWTRPRARWFHCHHSAIIVMAYSLHRFAVFHSYMSCYSFRTLTLLCCFELTISTTYID